MHSKQYLTLQANSQYSQVNTISALFLKHNIIQGLFIFRYQNNNAHNIQEEYKYYLHRVTLSSLPLHYHYSSSMASQAIFITRCFNRLISIIHYSKFSKVGTSVFTRHFTNSMFSLILPAYNHYRFMFSRYTITPCNFMLIYPIF